jgi:DNA adenine methylase
MTQTLNQSEIKLQKVHDIGFSRLSNISKKDIFLNSIKSSGKLKYKRFNCSTLRYAGGKSLAVGLVVELLPDNIDKLVSPFFGGGSVEIACSSQLGLKVIGYDIFDLLVNYWVNQINNPIILSEELAKFSPTKDNFKLVKETLRKHWKGECLIDDKVSLAAHYYFNHNTSYGPHFLGSPSSVYLQEKRYNNLIEKVKNFNAGNIKVECDSFENTIKKHKKDFLYCDPPYYLGGESKTFVGMYPHRNFPIHHKGFKHEILCELLKKHKGGFILSYNDCPEIREMYKDFEMYSPEWQYTFSQGDTRIGKNRLEKNNGSHIKKSHELIIWKK